MQNELFKNAVKLTERVAVYVPGTCGVDTLADTEAWIDRTAAALSDLFGGATVTRGSGCWMSDAAGLVREPVTIVYAFAAPGQIEANADQLQALVYSLKTELQQEAISVEINGTLYLV